MKIRRSSRSVLVAGAALVVLTACGASAPPGKELADEVIETLESNGVEVSQEVKDCMHKAVADFEVTEEGFDDLDDVAAKAADGQAKALEIMQRFEDELAACNPAG